MCIMNGNFLNTDLIIPCGCSAHASMTSVKIVIKV